MGFINKFNTLAKILDEHVNGPPLPPPPSREERIKESVNVIKSHSISCRCGGLALPLKFIGKIYKCIRCDRQFANTQYKLSGLKVVPVLRNGTLTKSTVDKYDKLNNIMHFYDDAVALIKKEDQLKNRS